MATQRLAGLTALILTLIAIHGSPASADPAAPAPAPRWHMSSVYDPAHREVLIYGGFIFPPAWARIAGDSDSPMPVMPGPSRHPLQTLARASRWTPEQVRGDERKHRKSSPKPSCRT